MKISRDYLKNIISEELKALFNEQEETVITSNPKVIAYARYLKSAFQGQDIKSLTPETLNNLLDNKEYAGLTSDEKNRAIGLVLGKRSQWPENLRNITVQMGSEETPEVTVDATLSPKEKRIAMYARMVKKLFANTNPNSMSPESISSALEDESFKDLTYQEKMQGLKILYGNMTKWPENIRTVAMGMNPNPADASVASMFGQKQKGISLAGKGGVKCAHAAAIQTKAKQVVQTLAKQFGIDEQQIQKLISRLSDGVMGNTTLGIMKALSGGQMTDKDYPLNNVNSYKKACTVQKELLDSILNMMNTKPQESAKVVMSAAGIQTKMGESKNAAFEKALKAAILRELQKNS